MNYTEMFEITYELKWTIYSLKLNNNVYCTVVAFQDEPLPYGTIS